LDIAELLMFTVQNDGSDLHISAGEQPYVRIHGEMRKVEIPRITAGSGATFSSRTEEMRRFSGPFRTAFQPSSS
jgi:Tfp pilus assembly pilus retraction ATPase PilT